MHLVTTILVPILLVIIQLRVWPGARKLPQAGTHREISRFHGSRFPGSRFPGRPVRPWCWKCCVEYNLLCGVL